MSPNSKPESPAQASRKRPLTRSMSEEDNAENKQNEMTKAYENVEEVAKSGYLSKSGKGNPKYNRYRFRPNGDVLSYYQDPKDHYFPAGCASLDIHLYKQQEKRIEKAGPIRRCFMALFNTSYIGINADNLRPVRTRGQEAHRATHFKKALITAHDAGQPRPGDGKPLHFRPTFDHRPRARYLYFLYVSAILKKKAWDHRNRRKPEEVLKD
ncbi:uncharacterized protein B0T23DRAFT_441145 [Neurospora hispaniola]|uniref:Uncharacterized protein n=1 Tax=Neurospora hispaniola TaxID=588809 RepID=A0AAJ0IB60_9PEZI|nr:hypothetical protein B0T23DRAFT_441145 [Neurospora hispaniola]